MQKESPTNFQGFPYNRKILPQTYFRSASHKKC